MPDSHARLLLVLGDQLDHHSPLFAEYREGDAFWMAENEHEATYVASHKTRLLFFFSAMRHFASYLRERGYSLEYHQLEKDARHDSGKTFSEILRASIKAHKPGKLLVVEPGDFRVEQELRDCAAEAGLELEMVKDTSFYCSKEEFESWSSGRKSILLEYFYREMRKRHDVLMNKDSTPRGGEWNYDTENREAFTSKGPPQHKRPRSFSMDETTEAVRSMIEHRFASHPGSCKSFDLPVDRKGALALLRDFLEHRFSLFGQYQDAMWQGETFLFHSRLSALLNVKLLRPREVIERALEAAAEHNVPLSALEGFIRQILGWREYVRGVYWAEMPEYADANVLAAEAAIPSFYWDGQTDMACMKDAMSSVLHHSYAHHIQRLMVLGQYALLLGINPYEFHRWHMAMYADAIDWVSLPNVLGMSQFADGGLLASKPYCASGNYINKMSNYCKNCRFNPKEAVGERACPFTTLYWSFLDRHQKLFRENRRMQFQIKNLERKDASELKQIRKQAKELQERAG